MKKFTLTLTAVSLAASAAFVSTTASAEVTANVAVTNNYLWRGLEQTGGDAAVSGGIDYAHDSGFYAGTWVSNAWGGTELDLYGGFSSEINEKMSYDVGFIYYAYPDIDDSDFSEIYGSFTFTDLTLGLAVLASSEDYDAGDSIYVSADYVLALSNEAEVNFHIGNYSGDFSTDSTDLGVSISKDNFTFGVSKTDYESGVGSNSDDVKFYVAYSVDIAL
jgi:uncharacterized protein (TIGR02001 family)